ncbi:MAG: amidoligase family protein [Synergistaceae bacterium]|nr:amidoligase family protein [Synergistaceae bacterium]
MRVNYADFELSGHRDAAELLRLLRKAGAKSSPSRGCGVHIHIGKGEHTPQTIRNLTNIMAAHEKQIGRAIKIAEHRTETYCKVINKNFLNAINANAPKTFDALADIWYTTNDANYGRDTHYNTSRYHMLNLHALFTKGTIEFRLFQFDEPHGDKKGGLHAGQLKAYIQLCLAMSELAKELKSASPKPQQTENERYDFRCWMLRLGFIGEEFKTAREILLKNMTGNGAYR